MFFSNYYNDIKSQLIMSINKDKLIIKSFMG